MNSIETVTSNIEQLREWMSKIDGELHIAICTHPTPDPDAIASALGMEKLLKHIDAEVKVTIVYSGEISHSQNKTLINVLGVNLTPYADIEKFEEFADGYITVDAIPERCFENTTIKCVMCIDHHRGNTKLAKIKDIRQVGACSSLVWQYLVTAGVELDPDLDSDVHLATALVVGIKTDTNDFVSDTRAEIDFEAHKNLLNLVDKGALAKIINYPIPSYFFELRSQLDKPDNAKVKNGVFVGGIGIVPGSKRDTLPMMAEERSRAEGVETAFVFAIVDDHIDVSVRSVSPSVEVNGVCQKLFGKQYAGGKQGAGAANIPLHFMSPSVSTDEVQESIWNAVKQKMFEQVFEMMT